MANQWFRFYSETLRDRKLERIAHVTERNKAELVGIWVTLLSLANDSPEPGILLLVDSIPLNIGDFSYETGLPEDELEPIIKQFIRMDMLSLDGSTYYIKNWDKRQFKSDNVTERVQRHRERLAMEQQTDDDVTLPERFSNAPEQNRTESDTEAEQETDGAKNAPVLSHFEEIRTLWIELFPNKPKPRSTNSINGKIKTRMNESHFKDNWQKAMQRAARSNYLGLKDTTWFDLGWFLDNDTNYEKCLNGKYDIKPGTYPQPPARAIKPVSAKDL